MRSIPDLRFGERLRSEQRKNPGLPVRLFPDEAEAIAAAIDQDAEALQVERDGFKAIAVGLAEQRKLEADSERNLGAIFRQQVEEAVERLQVPMSGAAGALAADLRMAPADREATRWIKAEPFLAELDRIFGDRQEGQGTRLDRERILRLIADSAEPLRFDEEQLTFQERNGCTYAYHRGEYVFRVTAGDQETITDLLAMAYNSGRHTMERVLVAAVKAKSADVPREDIQA